MGVNPAVAVDQRQHTLHIGSVEFCQHPEFQHLSGDLVIAPGAQDFSIGGITGLRLFPGGSFSLSKKNTSQLLRGVDIEFSPALS